MSPGEHRLLAFVATRLESMLRRPAVWGSLHSVEERILQLLELRRVLLVPSVSASDTKLLLRAYVKFVASVLEGATAEPLALQLERQGRAAEFTALMGKFVEAELAMFLVEVRREPSSGDANETPMELDTIARVLESLRLDAEAHAGRRPSPRPEPIEFPGPEHRS
jgi:hypothetical protein